MRPEAHDLPTWVRATDRRITLLERRPTGGTGGGSTGPHQHDEYLLPAEVLAGQGVTVTDNGDGTITIASAVPGEYLTAAEVLGGTNIHVTVNPDGTITLDGKPDEVVISTTQPPTPVAGPYPRLWIDPDGPGVVPPAHLPLSGGTLTGALFLHADPTTGPQAATKAYVDAEDAAHANAADPHPQYLTLAEGDARYGVGGGPGQGLDEVVIQDQQPPAPVAGPYPRLWIDTDDDATSDAAPPGAIVMWPFDTLPNGWLLCDGGAVDAAVNPVLAGRGMTHTPDLRGLFVMGGSTPNLTPAGSNTATLVEANLPPHQHSVDHDHGSVATGGQSATHTHTTTLYPFTAFDSTSGGRPAGGDGTAVPTTPTSSVTSGNASADHTHNVDLPNYQGPSGNGNGTSTPVDVTNRHVVLVYMIKGG